MGSLYPLGWKLEVEPEQGGADLAGQTPVLTAELGLGAESQDFRHRKAGWITWGT